MFKEQNIPLFIKFLSVFFIALPAYCTAQLINYDSNGGRIRAAGEKISIVISKKADYGNKALTGPISFSGVIGSVIGLSIDVTKGILASAAAKYTATYAASKSENELIYFHKPGEAATADLNIDRITVTRFFLNAKGDWQTGCQVYLSTQIPDNSGLFRFKLDSLNLPYTKAKIKKVGSLGKRVDLSITVKLEALWQDAAAKEAAQAGGTAPKTPATTAESSSQMKSATLGEATIFVSSITPEGKIRIPDDCYSGWFQLLPATALKFANAENKWKVGNYVVTITVKEANPYGLKAKEMADFFNTTGTDLGSFLKQFFPDTSKKN